MVPLLDRIVYLSDPQPHSAPENMAIDEVLLKSATEPILRTYRWARPSVSFGYFEPYERIASQYGERELVRRWTGGGTVLHGEDFTYTLIAPRGSALERLRIEESYLEVHRRVSSLLGGSLAEEKSTDHATACFQNPTIHDVVLADRKIAGAAQRRSRWGLLHQGSIQQVGIPESMAEELAKLLAANVSVAALSAEVLEKASACAAERYGTDAWLKRV